THRKLLQSKAIAIENDLRGTLRNFGLKVGMVGTARFEARIQELVETIPTWRYWWDHRPKKLLCVSHYLPAFLSSGIGLLDNCCSRSARSASRALAVRASPDRPCACRAATRYRSDAR